MASAEENESKCEKARRVLVSPDGQVHGGGEVRGEVNINQVCTNKYDECWFPKCSAFCQTPISREKAVWRE